MRLIRRGATADRAGSDPGNGGTETTAEDGGGAPGGKGRPTPKRRDQVQRRRTPVVAPTSRREAAKLARRRRTDARLEQRKAIMSGDESKLGARDAGPVRRLARDLVDSRHTVGSYLLIVLVVVYLPALLIRSAQTIGMALIGAYFVLVLAEGFLLARRAKRLATERYPDHSRAGLGLYTAMRAAQLRRLRLPPPKVKVGDRV